MPLCMNLPRYGVCDALPHPKPLFTDLHTFNVFFIGTQFKKMGMPPHLPHPGSGRAYITISSLLLQLRNEK